MIALEGGVFIGCAIDLEDGSNVEVIFPKGGGAPMGASFGGGKGLPELFVEQLELAAVRVNLSERREVNGRLDSVRLGLLTEAGGITVRGGG